MSWKPPLLREKEQYAFWTVFPCGREVACIPTCSFLRVAEGIEGEVQLTVEIAPRFDYGAIRPWIKKYRKEGFVAFGGEGWDSLSRGIIPSNWTTATR